MRKVTKEELRDMILKGEDISEVDYSDVRSFNELMSRSPLTQFPSIDTSKILDMDSMFFDCSYLEEISQMDTSNVNDMDFMFYGCSSLRNIPALNTINVLTMDDIFDGCTSIETIEKRPSDWLLYDWNSPNAPQHLRNKYPELYI